MKIIGLCGGSGSGKGTVCAEFARLGIPSVDTDAVYHELTSRESECLSELVSAFGDKIITKSHTLDRKALADVVFGASSSDEKRALLNKISHKHILKRTGEILDSYRSDGVRGAIVDAPLLFESGFDKECDVTVAVLADRDLRVRRIMRRDGISEERAIARISSQLSDEELSFRCDFVIVNNGEEDSLSQKVAELAEKIFEI